jgi:hypothetical protein
MVTIPHRGLRPTDLRLSRAEAISTIQPRPVIRYALPVADTHGLGRWNATEMPRGAPGMGVGMTVADRHEGHTPDLKTNRCPPL